MSTLSLTLRLFSPHYARSINTQLVYPAQSQLVKPNELYSALYRPVQTAKYEPDRSPAYLAATLAYGLINGHPFLEGNKRTAFFLANEYLRAHGLPTLGLDDSEDWVAVADRYVTAASGRLDVKGLAFV